MDTPTTLEIPVRFILVNIPCPLAKSTLSKVEVAVVAEQVERDIVRSLNEMAYAD